MTTLVCLALLFFSPLAPQDDAAMQQRLGMLEGDWTTVSTFPATGEVAPGELSYHWILGGAWLECRFQGKRTDGRVWEAYAWMRWDPARNCYVSWDIFGATDPLFSRGEALGDNGIRFVFQREGAPASGIDYFAQPDGSIYQENWATSDAGGRVITLKTDYARAH